MHADGKRTGAAHQHLAELEEVMSARGWACEFVEVGSQLGGDRDVLLRMEPPDGHGDPYRAAEVLVRDSAEGPYFAWGRTPERPIGLVGDIDHVVRVIVHVVGGHRSPPPPLPPGFSELVAALSEEEGPSG